MGGAPSQKVIDRCNKCDNRLLMASLQGKTHCAIPCPEGEFRDSNGKCLSCSFEGTAVSAQSECKRCSNRFIGNWGGIPQGCYRCDYQSVNFGVWATDSIFALCEKNCPNRTLIQSAASAFCALNCPATDQVLDQQGQCHTCDEESEYFDVRGILDSCYQCEGIRFIGDAGNIASRCFRCDSPQQSIFLSWEWTGKNEDTIGTCRACPNRVVINGSYCAKYCENGKIWDNKGECHTCDEEADFNVQGVPENKCACPGVRYLDGNTCKKCPEDVSALTPEQQVQCDG